MPKFSIITVNLNNAEGLEKTIHSILNQTNKDFEYIIIDGGSSDKSLDLIKNYSSQLKYWVSEKDNGIYNAMNKGILRATGEYCLFLNSGDYLINKNILDDIISVDVSEDILSGDVITYSNLNQQKSLISKIRTSEITFSDLFEASLNHQATFIKRSLFTRYGLYEEKYRIISDWIFTIKTIILNEVTFKYMDKVITFYNIDGSSGMVPDYYNAENLPALKELIPSRILSDYATGYVHAIKRMKKYYLFWTLFRLLNMCTVKYDSFSERIKTRRQLKRLLRG
jgi:glycosyltransferase involved in cell wall biosynthesis